MKKVFTLVITLLLFVFFSATVGFAQVDLTASGGTPNGSYSTLKDAFDAINLGTHTGVIAITITGTSAETASAVLNASGSGSASYSSLSIQPSGAAVISGAIFGHLIDLNGADNVTIDGLNSGGNSLTISNSGTTSASTIRFGGDAIGNTVTNSTLLGATAVFGVVYFGTGTTTGNDNNTVSNCNIGPVPGNYPLNGIYSMGSSAVIDNSGNTITGNNIYDYFNASSASNGMNINSFNTAWTISNNRFYQTASRTFTSASTHNGIVITSGAGYTITGNIIGYADSEGSGTYAMAGAVATRFVAINVAANTTADVSSIQGNTVTAISLGTTSNASTANGVLCGISVTAGNANIGNITPNTIGGASGTGLLTATPTVTQGAIVGINTSSTGTILIQNNILGGFTSVGATAAIAGTVSGINVSGIATLLTITGNTIGNSTANNMRGGTLGFTTGASWVQGIYFGSTPTSTIITNNTIQNLASYGTTSAGYVRGMWTPGVSGVTSSFTITGNTFANFITNAPNVSIANAILGAVGIHLGQGNNSVISGNTIYNIEQANTGASGYLAGGIAHANATNTIIRNNKIYGIINASTSVSATAPGIAYGILIRSGTTAVTVQNNMISLGRGQATNTAFIGIQGNHGSTPNPIDYIYYNTINIEGTAASGSQPSFGFYRGDFSTTARTITVDVRNNIINNTRSGGTGKHYAIANNYGATTVSATGWGANASNYNVLNAAASTVGYWGADKTFEDWKTASASDNNSLTNIPVSFQNAAEGDLHLAMGTTPSQLESGGTAIASVTTDYDGQTRPGPAGSVNGGAFLPDFGADEFDGVFLDLIPPAISYIPLPHTPSTAIRTLTATITDVTGVPSAPLDAGLPMLYWKTPSTAYTGVQGVFVTGNSYSFTFGAGVSLGDVVSYYIVAQDMVATPNVGGYPLGGSAYTANPPAAGVPTSTPSTYIITNAPLSGDYTVGLSDFNNLAGTNVYFEKVTRKVVREVFVEETPVETDQSATTTDSWDGSVANPESIVSDRVNGRMELKEIEEVTWVPMENGLVYEGPLSVTRSNDPALFTDAPMAGVYATITAAVADLNLRGVSGPTRFLLNDANYSTGETFPITVNVANENLPTAANPVAIKPNAEVISLVQCPLATPAGQVFQIRNSYFTIDGSNTPGGTSRDLTIENQYATGPQVIRISSTGTVPITNVTIKNCIIINGATNSSALIVTDMAGTASYFNNITVQNNSIQKAYIGTYFLAVVAPGNGSGSLVTGNDLNTAGANSIRLIGVYMQGVDGATVSNNNIGNMSNTNAELTRAIMYASGTYSGTISGNTISNMACTSVSSSASVSGIYINPGSLVTGINVSGNTISTMSNTGTLANFTGIMSFSPNTSVNNNIVSGMTQNGAVGFWGIVQVGAVNSSCSGNTVSGLTTATTGVPNGINIQGASSGVTVSKNKVFNIKNTNVVGTSTVGLTLGSSLNASDILVSNNFISDIAAYGLVSQSIGNGYGIAVYSGGGYNIYANSVNLATDQTLATGVPACFFISSAVTAAGSLNVRNNIFSIPATIGTNRYAVICNAPNTVFAAINHNDYYTSGPSIGYYNALDVTDLAAWRTAVGQDANSVSGDPKYVGPSDLHIQPAVYSPVRSAGVAIAQVTDDIDGNPRSNPPDIGAAEDGYLQLSLSGTPNNISCNGLSDGSISTLVGGGLAPYVYLWSNSATTAGLTGLTAGVYSLTVTDALSSVISDSWTITQPALIGLNAVPVSASCPEAADGGIDLTVDGGTMPYTYLWSTLTTNQDLVGVAAGTYSVTVTDGAGCTATGAWDVLNVTEVCSTLSVTGDVTSTVCYNATGTITVAGSGSFTVQSGGSATFIAGGNIIYLPGTKVFAGGYMHGYISTTYCSVSKSPAGPVAETGGEEMQMNLSHASFTLYPNPTTGNFTLVQKGDRQYDNVKVEIYSMRGDKVLTSQMIGEKQHEFVTSGLPAGLYFVKLVAEDYTETIKLIKTR